MKQEAQDYVAMIYQSEGDNHAIINYVVHGLGLMFGAHTNTGTLNILVLLPFLIIIIIITQLWPILIILCAIVRRSAGTLGWVTAEWANDKALRCETQRQCNLSPPPLGSLTPDRPLQG